MNNTLEERALSKFHNNLIQDIRATQLSDEEGGTTEQIFTQFAVDLLAAAGETENVRLAYDQKGIGTKNQHQINAYSISDNYETIDLFITVLKGTDDVTQVNKSEIETASKRIVNFFRKGIYKDYVHEIEESSEIFQFAYTLSQSAELKENLVRVNAVILTEGVYQSDPPAPQIISGHNVYYRVIDLNYLYNITEKSHIPIEIDFQAEGFEIPCIEAPTDNAEYKSYLAIMPATALASIYERFGARLLEQNVRSFLQFSGKINKGIRNTILKEPEMFMAFNNGISATADSIFLENSPKGSGLVVSKITDLQIVNGGQTTASIYHTLKKDKADLTPIFVQVKISVVKNKENFSEIVGRIAEYANTQNKVSVADLSSNRPFHIELEKQSRSIYTPHNINNSTQTKWFYERARGQYKNARLKEGFTKGRQKAFDLKVPKSQVFTKEELAKYINAYQEINDGKKVLIGPHFVVQGNQKNYLKFMLHNLEKKLTNVYFEDAVAKAILFRATEKLYGVRPNSIGDMRYVTVPYTLAVLNFLTKNQLDLYKIWKEQAISEALKSVLHKMMVAIETHIKTTAPGGLYGEWAKREECWAKIKDHDFQFDLTTIKKDMIDAKNSTKRTIISEDVTQQKEAEEQIRKLKSIPHTIWKKIEDWGRETENLSPYLQNMVFNITGRVRTKSEFIGSEVANGLTILDIVIEKAPEILFEIDEILKAAAQAEKTDISLELVQKIVQWERRNKRLKDYEYQLMADIAEGKKPLTEQIKKIASLHLEKVKRYGFRQ